MGSWTGADGKNLLVRFKWDKVSARNVISTKHASWYCLPPAPFLTIFFSSFRSIAAKRREFEYKIQRRTKCKDDFVKYIQFEVNLHRVVKGRREVSILQAVLSEVELYSIRLWCFISENYTYKYMFGKSITKSLAKALCLNAIHFALICQFVGIFGKKIFNIKH